MAEFSFFKVCKQYSSELIFNLSQMIWCILIVDLERKLYKNTVNFSQLHKQMRCFRERKEKMRNNNSNGVLSLCIILYCFIICCKDVKTHFETALY